MILCFPRSIGFASRIGKEMIEEDKLPSNLQDPFRYEPTGGASFPPKIGIRLTRLPKESPLRWARSLVLYFCRGREGLERKWSECRQIPFSVHLCLNFAFPTLLSRYGNHDHSREREKARYQIRLKLLVSYPGAKLKTGASETGSGVTWERKECSSRRGHFNGLEGKLDPQESSDINEWPFAF